MPAAAAAAAAIPGMPYPQMMGAAPYMPPMPGIGMYPPPPIPPPIKPPPMPSAPSSVQNISSPQSPPSSVIPKLDATPVTMYVGKLPAEATDDLIRTILEVLKLLKKIALIIRITVIYIFFL